MPQFSLKELEQLRSLIASKDNIVIFPHTAPDGDALGSTIGLCKVLQSLYPEKSIHVISPDHIERYLLGVRGVEEIVIYPQEPERALALITSAELLLHLDHNQVSRLRYAPLIDAVLANPSPRILIDHHLYPEEGFELSFSYPEMSSTCELIYCLIKEMELREHITPQIATAITTGIITDTGRFMYGCFSPKLYEHFSDLLALGADYAYITDQLSYHGSLQELKLKGYILHEKLEVLPELGAAIITLSQEEIQSRQITKGDTEGLVNLPLSVEGIDCVCFIREDKTQIKLSLRSIGSLAVNEIAMRAFSGGGHLNAAGGEHQGTIASARELFIEALKEVRNEQSGSI